MRFLTKKNRFMEININLNGLSNLSNSDTLVEDTINISSTDAGPPNLTSDSDTVEDTIESSEEVIDAGTPPEWLLSSIGDASENAEKESAD